MEKIKKMRGISILLMFIMVFQLIIPVNFAYGAEEITVADIDGTVVVTTKDGVTIDKVGGKYVNIPTDAKIKINYKFELPNEYDYENGDYIEIPLPDGLNFGNMGTKEIKMDGVVVATYVISNDPKALKITFNEFVEQKSNIKGEINLEGTFKDAGELGGGSKSIEIEYVGTIDFEFKPKEVEPGSVGITKSGEYDPETGEITWAIIVKPDNPTKAVTVVDTIIGDNHTLVTESIKVTSGTAIDVTSSTAITINGKSISFGLGQITGEHKITFKTKPTNNAFAAEDGTSSKKESVLFENGAIVKIGETEVDKTKAEIKIDWIQKGGSFEIVSGRGIITWTININNQGLKITDPKIKDIIPNGVSYIDDTAKLNNIIFDNPSSVELGDGRTELTFSISGELSSKAILTYQTEVENWENYLKNNDKTSFKNDASLSWDELGELEGPSDYYEATIIGRGGILSKTAEGTRTYNDLNNGDLINWTTVVNRNGAKIDGAITFTDNIPDSLLYVENTFKVFNSVGTDVTSSVGAFSIQDVDTLRYVFNSNVFSTGDTYTIKFTTKIDDKNKLFETNGSVSYSNSAKLSGGTLTKDATSTGTQYFNSKMIEKDVAKAYDYKTKEVVWKIVVNQNNLYLENAKLVDNIPDGMVYVPETFKVTSPSAMNAALVTSDNPDYDSDSNILTFNFGTLNKQKVEVEFKTRVIDSSLGDKGDITFKNVAKLTSDSFLGKEVTDDFTITVKNPIVEKNGKLLNGDAVKWTVPINANSIELYGKDVEDDAVFKGISLTDVLNDNLTLDVSSVKLYNAELENTSGTKLQIVGSEVSNSEYLVEYDKNNGNTFVFTFKEKINSPYILEFVTSLDRSATINNKITLKGTGMSKDEVNSNVEISFTKDADWATGETGSLTVKKVDESGTPLDGAEFKIYRKNNTGSIISNSVKTGTTVEGEIVFENLLYKTYYVEETKAPNGYLPDKTVKTRIVTSDNGNLPLEFINKKIEASIEFIKIDDSLISPQLLEGAEFELFAKNESGDYTVSKGTKMSGSNGIVKFEKLPAGEYKIVETKAPKGYLKSEDVYVVIGPDADQTGVNVTFNNDYINEFSYVNVLVGNIELKKVGRTYYEDETYKDIPLKGAEFALLYTNEEPVLDDEGKAIKAVSNDDGDVIFANIPVGEYIVVETDAPDGYVKAHSKIYVNINRNDENPYEAIVEYALPDEEFSDEITVVNDSIDIRFNKVDKDEKPLDGAVFALKQGETVIDTQASKDGKIIFEGVPAGEYTIEEVTPPAGYKALDKIIEVIVGIDADITFTYEDETYENGGLNVVNERRPSTPNPTPVLGSIAIKKTDEDKKVLSGAEFTLYDEDGKVVDRGVTGSDGTLTFDDLEPGKYILKETKAPEGYVLEVDETNVTVVANRTNTYTFTNKKEEPKKPGRIDVVKVDEEGTLLSDAWFSLIDSNGTTLQNAVTVNGRVSFEDVPVGRYKVEEVQAPDGYELTSQTVNVTVDSEETVTLRFVNKKSGVTVTPVSGRITINKVDEDNAPLAGAEFTLYNENNEIVGTAVSDASGRVVFDNLSDGRYFVKETEAPAGYRLVSDSLTVNVAGGSSNSYRFRNVPDTEDIGDPDIPLGWEEIEDPDVPRDGLPNTGSLLDTWLLITTGIMLIFAGMLLYRRKPINN